MPPAWANLVSTASADWSWRDDGRLVHRLSSEAQGSSHPPGALHRFVVKHVYADHNASKSVQDAIAGLIRDFEKQGGWGVNLGAGETRLHERLLNVDIVDAPNIDVVVHNHLLPFGDGSVDLVMSQEALEHIADFHGAVGEVARIVRPGGLFYCQVPFIIGFHPGPSDYWRFSRQALEYLFESDEWSLERLEISVGFGTGFYRILIEFLATIASAIHPRIYRPAKAVSAILFYWVKLFDRLSHRADQRDRIPGGYFVVARRRAPKIVG